MQIFLQGETKAWAPCTGAAGSVISGGPGQVPPAPSQVSGMAVEEMYRAQQLPRESVGFATLASDVSLPGNATQSHFLILKVA